MTKPWLFFVRSQTKLYSSCERYNFKDNLCIFPFVSRKFYEFTNGVCREEYRRYRIDDHIYHVFNLLALLGHKRIGLSA